MLSKNNIDTIDINILFSMVNMKLRNDYSSVSRLCSSFEIDEKQLLARLEKEGYLYDEKHNHFYHKEG